MKTDQVESTRQEVIDLWIKVFQGEALGEAYFARMTQLATDAGERAKLAALVTLERSTKELLIPYMEAYGISTTPDTQMLDAIASTTAYDYQDMLSTIPALAAEYLDHYCRLRALVPADDAAVVDSLIAHELALELFMRRELAGETETSLVPIRALAHVDI